ncbi:hypothetical protein L1987_24644 [Smallanthus sonchifolius]|uniref:Uncharacterized protein n=1 Tax=Smallanthus sonchifolius TaxID=185202 RepID=A0ACB9ILL5_9ASTR|nr:hypothetical protein L1987_24644 [Smallanthus sonchifolius]
MLKICLHPPLSSTVKSFKGYRRVYSSNLHYSIIMSLWTHHSTPLKNFGSYGSWKKSISNSEQGSSVSNAPPNKINGVIPSTAGATWNAFVRDELVPDSIKQQCERRFMLTVNNTKHNEQIFSVKWIFWW